MSILTMIIVAALTIWNIILTVEAWSESKTVAKVLKTFGFVYDKYDREFYLQGHLRPVTREDFDEFGSKVKSAFFDNKRVHKLLDEALGLEYKKETNDRVCVPAHFVKIKKTKKKK